MVADFAGAHAVLPVGEAELYGVGGIGCGRAQQFGALFRQQGVERTGDLLPEYEAGEQEGCQQQRDERSEDDPRDFQGFFHGSKVFPAAKIQHRIEKRSGLRQECCRLAFRAVPAGAGLPAETFGAPDGQAPALSGCKGGDFPEIYYL